MPHDEWAKQRPGEREVNVSKKRKKAPRVMVLLAPFARAAAATNTQKSMVWIWLLHRSWLTGKVTIPVPNGALAKYGVNRISKILALRQLEAAELITVEWRSRKTPIATLLH
jgi:hypothetical protein